jgi:hypothetical protein
MIFLIIFFLFFIWEKIVNVNLINNYSIIKKKTMHTYIKQKKNSETVKKMANELFLNHIYHLVHFFNHLQVKIL